MTHEIFVPGRLAIQGEHTDWISSYRDETNPFIDIGLCLVAATNEGIFARVASEDADDDGKSNPTFVFEHVDDRTGDTTTFTNSYDLHGLEEEARNENSFFSYVAGATASVLETYFSKGERNLVSITITNYKTTLPMGKGLSSSAAISVLVVKCFNAVYELNLTLNEIMAVAFKGERKTRSECGMMDFCVVMGQDTAALMVMADGGYCRLNLIKNKEPLYFVVADLRADPPKNTVEILSSLNNCFPLPKCSGDTRKGQIRMHDYAHESASLCLNSVEAIEKGDKASLAAHMNTAQVSFDAGAMLVCPSQLQSPYLHRAIDILSKESGALAVKGVGSQGDGSVQVLCADAEAQARVMKRLSESDVGAEGFLLTLPAAAQAEDNPHALTSNSRVRVAVLVVRGAQAAGDHQEKTSDGTDFGLDSVSATEAAILACGVQHVCTVFENDEQQPADADADADTDTGLSRSAGTEEKKEKDGDVSRAEVERGLAYGNYLREGRLRSQCTRARAAGSGDEVLHATIIKAVEAVSASFSLHADSKVLLCTQDSGNAKSLPREVVQLLLSSLGDTDMTESAGLASSLVPLGEIGQFLS